MSPLWKLWRRALFLRDAESAHASVVHGVALAKKFAPWSLRLASGVSVAGPRPSGVPPVVFGMEFLSRVGLAGGFDKNAEIVEALPDLGFGFAEIGTVTPKPQSGNERPRLFRDVPGKNVFNRMGFNNAGAAAIAERLRDARPRLPPTFRVGVNVGKNKDTPAELAHEDYRNAAAPFVELADFFVINVSSPNTPGLRSLQTEESLKRILDAVQLVASSRSIPVLVKLAPELGGEDLVRVISAGDSAGASGWVLTNTLAGSWPASGGTLAGGWSGVCLSLLSRERLKDARSATRNPLVSVGGIMDEKEALERRRLGADLVQIYSGWIYQGPKLPIRVARAIRG